MAGKGRRELFAQLSSQQQLTERLLTQIRFSSRLILVTGESGSGKSTIANHLLERSEFANQALILANAEDDGCDFRQQLLEQLIQNPVFNRNDHILESLFRNQDKSVAPQLIVIDHAESVPQVILGELIELIQRYPEHYDHPLGILLFAEPNDALIEAASHWEPERAIQMVVPELTRSESFTLAKQLFARAGYQAQVSNSDAIEKRIESARGNPGRIYQIVDDIVTGATDMSDLKLPRRPNWLIVLAVLLTMAVAGMLYQTISDWQRGDDEPIDQGIASISVVSPTDKDIAQAVSSPFKSGEVQDNTQNLPTPVGSETLSLKSPVDTHKQRVVVTGEVVNQLIESQDPTQKAEAAEKTNVKKAEAVVQLKSKPVAQEVAKPEELEQIPEPTPKAVEPVKKEEPVKVVESPVPVKTDPVRIVAKPAQDASTAELLAKPAGRYTLQLGAFSSRATAERFAKEKSAQESTWIYAVKRGSKTLYKVVYGDYANRNAALSGQASLKSTGQDSLLRTFKQVQSELQ